MNKGSEYISSKYNKNIIIIMILFWVLYYIICSIYYEPYRSMLEIQLKYIIHKKECDDCLLNLMNISIALELYAKDNQNHYPPDLKSLTGEYNGKVYIKELPVCPEWDLPYEYTFSSDPDRFTISCRQEDRYYNLFSRQNKNKYLIEYWLKYIEKKPEIKLFKKTFKETEPFFKEIPR
ncbi:MAG: hypothetical protein ABRQ37_11900 [Candidatus Eremiobacterota bacterium]